MYIEQAFKFKQDVWRYLLGILIVFILGWQIIGVIPLGIVSWFKASNVEEFITASESAFSTLFPLKSNLYLFLMLLTFIGGFVALLVVIKFLHHQSFIQLTTSRDKIDWGRFFFGFGIIAFLTITTTAFDFYSNPENYLIQFEWKSFSIMFLIVIVFLIIAKSVLGIGKYQKIAGLDWYVIPIIIWFAFFIYHFISVFITHKFMGKHWEDQQRERLVAKQQKRIDNIKQQLLKEDHQIAKSQLEKEQHNNTMSNQKKKNLN